MEVILVSDVLVVMADQLVDIRPSDLLNRHGDVEVWDPSDLNRLFVKGESS